MSEDWIVACILGVILWWLFASDEPEKPAKDKSGFYQGARWKRIRRKAIKDNKARYGLKHPVCERCGYHSSQWWRWKRRGMHVDHIKPRSLYPKLELVQSNAQVLCAPCNLTKGNRTTWNWRVMREWSPITLPAIILIKWHQRIFCGWRV